MKVVRDFLHTAMPSSRKIADGMYDDIKLRFLGTDNYPDFRTISDFRKNAS